MGERVAEDEALGGDQCPEPHGPGVEPSSAPAEDEEEDEEEEEDDEEDEQLEGLQGPLPPAPAPVEELQRKELAAVPSEPLVERAVALLPLVVEIFTALIFTVITHVSKNYGPALRRSLKSFTHFLRSASLSQVTARGWRRRVRALVAQPLARAVVWTARLLGVAALLHASADVAALPALGAQGVAALAAALLALWTQEVYHAVTTEDKTPGSDLFGECPAFGAAASDASVALEGRSSANDPALALALCLSPKVPPAAAALAAPGSKHAVEVESATVASGEYSASCP